MRCVNTKQSPTCDAEGGGSKGRNANFRRGSTQGRWGATVSEKGRKTRRKRILSYKKQVSTAQEENLKKIRRQEFSFVTGVSKTPIKAKEKLGEKRRPNCPVGR